MLGTLRILDIIGNGDIRGIRDFRDFTDISNIRAIRIDATLNI
jgi:hypothetical protein